MLYTIAAASAVAYALTAPPSLNVHAPAVAQRATAAPRLQATATEEETDYIVIGSGFGGLSCAGLLASRGYKVTVLEQHYEIGGCAHEFAVNLDGKPVPSDLLEKNPQVRKLALNVLR